MQPTRDSRRGGSQALIGLAICAILGSIAAGLYLKKPKKNDAQSAVPRGQPIRGAPIKQVEQTPPKTTAPASAALASTAPKSAAPKPTAAKPTAPKPTAAKPAAPKLAAKPAAAASDKAPAAKEIPAKKLVAANKPVAARKPLERLRFDMLASYEYVDEPVTADKPRRQQIPTEILAYNGQQTTLYGYMLPVNIDGEGQVRSFFLMKDLGACCFGGVPRLNEFVEVEVEDGSDAVYRPYELMAVTGKLAVGEKIEKNRVASLYRMTATRVIAKDDDEDSF